MRNSVHANIKDEFAELGINKCFYPSANIPYSEIGIEGAKTIDIIRTSGPTFFRELRIPFMTALQNGALMRVILATPNSEYIKDVEIMQRTDPNYQYVNNISEELIQSEINLGNISNGNIFLGHFQTQFRANILILDQKKAFYTPVLPPPKLSEDTVTFCLASGHLLTDCIVHFNTVYNMLVAQNKIRKIEPSPSRL